jgi:hypothetical protein
VHIVSVCNPVGIGARAAGGVEPGGVLQVLDRERQTAERPEVFPARQPRSASSSTIAFSDGLTASMRASVASINSSGDTCRRRIDPASASAGWNRSRVAAAVVMPISASWSDRF